MMATFGKLPHLQVMLASAAAQASYLCYTLGDGIRPEKKKNYIENCFITSLQRLNVQ